MKRTIQKICLAFSMVFFSAHAAEASSHRSVWLYHFSIMDNLLTIEELNALNINQVYLAVSAKQLLPSGENASEEYTNKLIDFVTLATQNGISVHAMTLMDKKFSLSENHVRAVEMVSWIVDFNNMLATDYPLSGIHIDTEPHTLNEWKSAKKTNDWDTVESIMAQYVDLLALLDPVIHGNSQLIFSAAIHWKYNEWAEQGRLPSGDTALLAQYLDVAVPMVYQTDSLRLIHRRSADEIEEIPTVVGIDATSFDTYANLISIQNELDEKNRRSAHYLGTSVHSFSSLSALNMQ